MQMPLCERDKLTTRVAAAAGFRAASRLSSLGEVSILPFLPKPVGADRGAILDGGKSEDARFWAFNCA
jgi:hypothetical protein